MDVWLQFFGRLHPLLLHLPIGVIVGLAAMEIWGRRPGSPGLERGTRGFLCGLSALAALASAGSGWMLSEEFGNSGDTFWWHRALGIAFALCATLASFAILLDRGRAYAVLLSLSILLVVPAGHFGAQLTHGAEFLIEPFAMGEAAAPVLPAADTGAESGASGYETVIAPIFEARCQRCHGAEKQKGGLALHEPAGLVAAGESGALPLVPGEPGASEILRRMRLALEDDEHMPPSSKPQPSVAEITAIESWIAVGAPFEGPLAIAPLPIRSGPAPLASEVANGTGETGAEVDGEAPLTTPPDPAPANPPEEAIQRLLAEQVHVEVIDPELSLLWIDFAGRLTTDDAFLLEHLTPLRHFVGELSLARTAVADGWLDLGVQMPRLERLDLSGTPCTSTGVAKLSGHPTLRWLNLSRTLVDDSVRATLEELPALQSVYLWNSALTASGLEALAQAVPDLAIEGGRRVPLQPLAVEPPIDLGAADALRPINTVCPVTGKALDPRIRIIHDSRVVGFCCTACPEKFWASPAEYPLDD